ncbi:hypothetical protein TSOC_009094 [Tetrabaena socialis]|uniref:Uncharacterized protein n=1 Tax=Tetrabaena socialis TaxID=47790 RepID=A0A2J7ZWR5_9CHLO|nr:hypothetical protein TSOC_009094 [Tetrabaena socialis]|eukprot:PNH04717.1 hypothetical protein TSOC_009094 [Tetrabaena socialis]
MDRRRSILAHARCRVSADGAQPATARVRFATTTDRKKSMLLSRLNKQQRGKKLLSSRVHRFKVAARRVRHPHSAPAGAAERAGTGRGGQVKLAAEVEPTPAQIPKELRVHVLHHRRWPRSTYLTGPHKVRCGCEGCAARQLNGEGPEKEGGYARKLRLEQRCGYWVPHLFVQHVAGVEFAARRQPKGVPPLKSQERHRVLIAA